MKNFIEAGDPLTAPAPTGGVTSGDLVVINALIGVASTTELAGAPVALKTKGVFELPKVSAQAWAVGTAVYWDGTAKNATTVSASTTLIGYATEAAVNPSTVGRVRIG